MKRAATLLLCVVSLSAALVRAYSVEPKTAAMSGWTPWLEPNNYVSEIVTCCWDSLEYCELFVGDKGAGGGYAAAVLVDGIPVMTSYGDRVPEYAWVRFDQWDDSIAFTKGKQYEFRFTRSGSESDLVGLDCGPADATMA